MTMKNLTKEELDAHISNFHDVGLEIRFILLAVDTETEWFPRIGLQCPYYIVTKKYILTSTDVIKHLDAEHNEDLVELLSSDTGRKEAVGPGLRQQNCAWNWVKCRIRTVLMMWFIVVHLRIKVRDVRKMLLWGKIN